MEEERQEGWASGGLEGGGADGAAGLGNRAAAAGASDTGGGEAERCRTWAERVREKGLAGLKEEYNRLRTDKATLAQEMKAFKAAPANLKRHAMVVVWDETRVRLRLPEDKKPGFIHANYARGPYTGRDFIMTQGPLPDTAPDFWGMVIQEKVGLILMLCRCEEETKGGKTKTKSEQYWPPDVAGTLQFPSRQLTVTNQAWADVDDKDLDGIQLRQSQLYLTRTSYPLLKRRPVTHLQMRNWPDMDVPPSALGMFQLIKHLEEREAELRNLGHMGPFSPIVVHCSAGVGRSGTLVALIRARHILLRCPGQQLDLFNVVLELRRQRHMSVQTEAQYVWLHTALTALLVSMGHLPASWTGPAAVSPAGPLSASESPSRAELPSVPLEDDGDQDPRPAGAAANGTTANGSHRDGQDSQRDRQGSERERQGSERERQGSERERQGSQREEGAEPSRPVLRRSLVQQPSQLSVPVSALPLPRRRMAPRNSPVPAKPPPKAAAPAGKPRTVITKTLCTVLRKPTPARKPPAKPPAKPSTKKPSKSTKP